MKTSCTLNYTTIYHRIIVIRTLRTLSTFPNVFAIANVITGMFCLLLRRSSSFLKFYYYYQEGNY